MIAPNFKNLRGEETYRRVCYSDRLSRTKDGELSDRCRVGTLIWHKGVGGVAVSIG
ncbi:MAG: hypothetical protein AAF974_05425 [Cyanobacteria bacterium P01_E01_bin.34]